MTAGATVRWLVHVHIFHLQDSSVVKKLETSLLVLWHLTCIAHKLKGMESDKIGMRGRVLPGLIIRVYTVLMDNRTKNFFSVLRFVLVFAFPLLLHHDFEQR